MERENVLDGLMGGDRQDTREVTVKVCICIELARFLSVIV